MKAAICADILRKCSLRSVTCMKFNYILNMEGKNVYFRCISLFYFRKGKNASQTHKKICAVYGENAVSESVCRKWFQKFRCGDFDLQDAPRFGRPVTTDPDQIKALIDSDRHLTTTQIGHNLNIDHSTVSRHLRKLGMVKKLDVWVPHELSEKNLIDRMSACDLLLKRHQNEPFLKRVITGDEKWIVYNNVSRKRSWSKSGEAAQTVAKAGLHPKKVMLSIWWDWKGIVYYELLPPNQTIDSTKYCSQLDKLKRAIDQERPELVNRKGVVFHHDNARPHVSLMTRQKLLQLGWDVLVHPPYSPDLAPSDYHLFRSLQNSLNNKSFSSLDVLKNHLEDFFAEKSQDFYKRGIMKLVDRWQKVIEQNGTYIVD